MIKLLQGDSAEILKTLESNSIDSMVTDPPAAISMMGEKWDSNKGGRDKWINWLKTIMEECLRVIKPGAHALVWSLPRTNHYTSTALEDAGFEIKNCIVHLFGTGFPKSGDISKSTSEEWRGWGTEIKPAAEFWILCRKPLAEKTISKNVLEWGTGAINIEASRIATTDNLNGGAYAKSGTPRDDGWHMQRGGAGEYRQPSGRFPTNAVLTHSPRCMSIGTKQVKGSTNHHQSQVSIGYNGLDKPRIGHSFTSEDGTETIENWDCENGCPVKELGDSARFFKQFIYQSKASKSDKGEDNIHPTSKSTALCEYFVKMITKPNGTVLDPFMGSGSIGVAATRNGFGFVGIELENEYFEISTRRINTA